MKKYIIEYELYDDILGLLGYEIPHSNLENVSTIIVDLTEEEYEALVGADIKIIENSNNIKLLYAPSNIAHIGEPPSINDYFNVDSAHTAGFDGTGVKVAILDSGCNDLHAATVPTLIRQDYTGLGANGDTQVHGSRGCLIIGQMLDFYTPYPSKEYGIAHGCQLYSMRVHGAGGIAAIINAIDWCIGNDIDIINISLEVLDATLTTAINAALAANIIVVCASGNILANNVAHPANIPGVIAVNAVEYNNAGTAFGSYLTVNGDTQITITTYNGGHYQTFTGGTSQAAFQISGLLAIYKQKYPTLNTQKAIRLLQKRALKMDNYTYNITGTNTTLNYQTGAGFVASLN